MKLKKLVGALLFYAHTTLGEPIDLRILKYHEEALNFTKYFSVKDRFYYLYLYDVPRPYPNMFMKYMEPEESVSLFMGFLKNNWDDDKTLQENWLEAVTIYNRKHHSLPIPITK